MHDKHKKNEEQKQETQSAEEPKTVTIPEAEYLRLKEDAAAAAEYRDRILRLQADFDNTRKRQEREKSEFVKFANEAVMIDLLNVLDDLERTVTLAQSKHQDLAAFLKGVEMILAHLYETLKKYGVRAIDSCGKAFDPNYHEALMQVERDDVDDHTIVEELQKGYTLNDRVIRTSKVSVSKKKEDGNRKTEAGNTQQE